jgi:hypothetical protein
MLCMYTWIPESYCECGENQMHVQVGIFLLSQQIDITRPDVAGFSFFKTCT